MCHLPSVRVYCPAPRPVFEAVHFHYGWRTDLNGAYEALGMPVDEGSAPEPQEVTALDAESADVEAVLETVQSLLETQQSLLETIEDQQRRIERLETLATTFGEIDVQGVDSPHDRAVIDAIRAADKREYTIEELRTLYKRHTNIRRPETLKQRVKTLTTQGPFEQISAQRWLYTGGPHVGTDLRE